MVKRYTPVASYVLVGLSVGAHGFAATCANAGYGHLDNNCCTAQGANGRHSPEEEADLVAFLKAL